MLDLVPLAGSGGVMTHGDGEPGAVGELLQLPLPQAAPGAVAAAAIGSDGQVGRAAIYRATHLLPPTANGVHGEAGGVVINAHTDPAFVPTQIVDAVGDRFALFGDDEIVHAHSLRRPFRAPLSTGILEVPHQLLLLGVHRDDRLTPLLSAVNLVVEVVELRVSIGVLGPLPRLAVRLQRIALLHQQLGHQSGADGVPHGLQFGRQLARALRRPAQRCVGQARRRRLQQRGQIRQQRRVFVGGALAPSPAPPNPLRLDRICRRQLLKASRNRRSRDPCRADHDSDATVPQTLGLGRRPQTARTLRQHRRQRFVFGSNRVSVHTPSYRQIRRNASDFFQLLSSKPLVCEFAP